MGTCTNFRKDGHILKDCWHTEGARNIPTYNYCNNIGHNNNYFHKIIKEQKLGNKNNKGNNTNKCGY